MATFYLELSTLGYPFNFPTIRVTMPPLFSVISVSTRCGSRQDELLAASCVTPLWSLYGQTMGALFPYCGEIERVAQRRQLYIKGSHMRNKR